MPYSSIDADRLNAYTRIIDRNAEGAAAGQEKLSNIGKSVGSGISGALGNRAAKIEQENKLKADLQDTLGMLEDQNRQQIMAGQDNSATMRLIDRVKQRLSQLGTVDLSAPTPTSPILKSGGMSPGNPGAGMIGA